LKNQSRKVRPLATKTTHTCKRTSFDPIVSKAARFYALDRVKYVLFDQLAEIVDWRVFSTGTPIVVWVMEAFTATQLGQLPYLPPAMLVLATDQIDVE
jgi:hypothetical protein